MARIQEVSVMYDRMLQWGGGLAGILGGALWVVLCVRFHLGVGAGDAVPPLRNTQFLFWVPLLLFTGPLGALYARSPAGWLARCGFGGAFGGALVGAAGTMIVSCVPAAQRVVGSSGMDCGPVGFALAGMGTGLLYVGLVVFGVAFLAKRTLPRWNALPLMTGLVAVGGLPLGYAGLALGGEEFARLLHTLSRVFFGIAWILLGLGLLMDGTAKAGECRRVES